MTVERMCTLLEFQNSRVKERLDYSKEFQCSLKSVHYMSISNAST